MLVASFSDGAGLPAAATLVADQLLQPRKDCGQARAAAYGDELEAALRTGLQLASVSFCERAGARGALGRRRNHN